MRFSTPINNGLNDSKIRAEWLRWAEREFNSSAAVTHAAAEAAIQTRVNGGTVDQAVADARAAAYIAHNQGKQTQNIYPNTNIRRVDANTNTTSKFSTVAFLGGVIIIAIAFFLFKGGRTGNLSGVLALFGALLLAFGFQRNVVTFSLTRKNPRMANNRPHPIKQGIGLILFLAGSAWVLMHSRF